jgi:hypothetical protein
MIKSVPLLRDGMTLCGIKKVLAEDRVDETFDILYYMSRQEKRSSEMVIKKSADK